MLDGILGRGFAAKCKSLLKLTMSRIDVIRRKRRATEKFLKKDIADLLLNGLDINAYGRAEGLLVELVMSSCYGFVEKSSEFVLKRLSVMQKLSGCPDECRVAVSSLMFAAARFSDLPELRDLRQIFLQRYGNSLECFVNQEFAANLNFSSSTLEKKVCLMQEIASEFSINWDSKAFKLRMSTSSAFAKGPNACISNHLPDYDKPSHGKDFTQKEVKNDVYGSQNGKETVILNKDHDLQSKSTVPGNEFKVLNGCEVLQERNGLNNPLTERQEITVKKSDSGLDDPLTGRQEVASKKSDRGYWKEGSMLQPIGRSSQKNKVEQFEGDSKLHGSWGNTTSQQDNQDTTTPRKSPSHAISYFRTNADEPIGCSSQYKKVEQFEGGSKVHDSWRNNTTSQQESQDAVTPRKSPSHARSRFRSNVNKSFSVNHVDLPDTDKCERKSEKDETPKLKPCFSKAIPPPYFKPNSKQNSTHGANLVPSHTDSDGFLTCPSALDKPDAASMSESNRTGLDNSDQDWQASRQKRLSKCSHQKEFSIRDDAKEILVVRPKSLRRKHSRSRSNHYDATNQDTGLVRKSRSRSRRRDESRRGLQRFFDDEQHQNAEEERLIDKLLIHYSKKPSILVPEKVKKNSKSHHIHLMDNSTRKLLKNGSRDGSDEIPDTVTLASRSVSLPREQPRAVEVKKTFARAATFQPDRSNEARHVHPKLPDYDDLAARFAALRGS